MMLKIASFVFCVAAVLGVHFYAYYAQQAPRYWTFIYMIIGALVLMAVGDASGVSRSTYAGYFYITLTFSVLVSLVFLAGAFFQWGYWIIGALPLILVVWYFVGLSGTKF